MTKPEVLNVLRSSMSSLTELGYTIREYDAGPEFGAIFESPQRNRKINFCFSAIIGQPFFCTISRSYNILFSLFWKSFHRRFTFDLHSEYFDDDVFRKLTRKSDTRDDLNCFILYNEFFRTTLSGIISGEKWIMEK
jgi:hypothetical protein